MTFRRTENHKSNQPTALQLEALESREMLSSVQIFAAGDLGGEQFDVRIDGATVASFTASQQLSTFEVQTDQPVTAGQVQIEFLNDQFDPTAGIDANLLVDAIAIDGVRFETEAPTVFSTGTFTNADGIVAGFGRGEVLHTNGFFQFADAASTQIEVVASGDIGNEQFNVIVDGETLGTFTASTANQTFSVIAAAGTTADDVRVEFINDQFDPENGVDANLNVDFIRIDGQTFQAEDSTVFSTGTFLAADGIVDGFGRGGTLHANGFLQFTDPLTDSVGADRTIAVDAGGFQAINSGQVIDTDGVGPGVAFVFNDGSGDLDLVNAGSIEGLGQAGATTADAGDGIRLAGDGTFDGNVVNNGLVTSVSTQGATSGFRAVNTLDFQGQLVNTGLIFGTNNGVYFGTGANSGQFVNLGSVTSDSRALNIDGDGLNVFNAGAIVGTGNQRNGTIYSDDTASNFEIVNTGLIDAGAGNEGAAISLSLDNDGSNGEINIFNEGSILGQGQAAAGLGTAGDGIRLEGIRNSDGFAPSLFEGNIVNSGVISSQSNQGTTGGFRAVNGVSFQADLVNTTDGLISGANNGVYFGTGDHSEGRFINNGVVASDSRAVNVDGDGLQVINNGAIVGTGDQRNGTIYVDGTAENFEIVNLEGGSIDAGAGNNGSGIGIEVGNTNGDLVGALVSNAGFVQGQGTSDSASAIGHGVRLFGGAGTDGTAAFAGDVVNSGTINGSAENELAAGISIENVGLQGALVNSGTIAGQVVAIDGATATSSLNLVNEGAINGDVVLGSANDVFTLSDGATLDGQLNGGSGFDVLNVNFANFEAGVEFVNSADLVSVERININGQQFV